MRRLLIAVMLLVTAAHGQNEAPEIIWDDWNVPHIYAESDADLAYAFGWAQARSHGDLLLRFYAQARGRAAEIFGEAMLTSDRIVHMHGIPERAQEWYDAQSDDFRTYLDRFAEGVNAYVREHPEQISDLLEGVVPLTGADLLAHAQRGLNFTFLTGNIVQGPVVDLWHRERAGSNGWAIAPERAEGDGAMLLGNPHLPWNDIFLFYEAHVSTPELAFYGATLVGVPVLALGFSEHLAWTHTVNTIDAADLYELTLADGGYLFDGEVRPFETEEKVLRVAQDDGGMQEVPLTVRQSIHGPVLTQEGEHALAIRVAGLDRPRALEQWWDMSRATDLATFESVLREQQLPMFNVIYADAAGEIMSLFNGLVPERPRGDWDTWLGVVPGDSSEWLWSDYLPFDALPRVDNPDSGWLQNANEPPWFMTLPYPLDPADYAAYVAPPGMEPARELRPQRSLQLLHEDPSIAFVEMVEDKFSNESLLAERVLPDLLAAAADAESELVRQAGEVLSGWDGSFEAGSRGAALFFLWYTTYIQELQGQALGAAEGVNEGLIAATAAPSALFERPWSWSADPLETPEGLADPATAVALLEGAAAQLVDIAGAPDVPWGELARMSAGDVELPATSVDGIFGVFQVLGPAPAPDGVFRVVGGDTFVFAVEFADPLRAEAILTYGNATQPGFPNVGAQLEIYARDELRPVYLDREQVEENAVDREVLE